MLASPSQVKPFHGWLQYCDVQYCYTDGYSTVGINQPWYPVLSKCHLPSKGISQEQTSTWTIQLSCPHKALCHCQTGLLQAQPPRDLILQCTEAAFWWHWKIWFHSVLESTAELLPKCQARSRVLHCSLLPRDRGEGLDMCPWVPSIPEVRLPWESRLLGPECCLCPGCEQSSALHKAAQRQPAGSLDLHSSANIYRKRSSFSILSRIRCSLSKVIRVLRRQRSKLQWQMVNT